MIFVVTGKQVRFVDENGKLRRVKRTRLAPEHPLRVVERRRAVRRQEDDAEREIRRIEGEQE